MSFSIFRVDKYMRWVKKTRAAYNENKRVSREYAHLCLKLDVAFLKNRSTAEIDAAAKNKHDYVLQLIQEICPDTIEKYRDYVPSAALHEPQEDLKVWSLWWQGEENADKLFRMCIDSARKQTGQEVIVLDSKNYSNYFQIPDYILDKYNRGMINPAHLCDFMVMSIMAEQGGFFTGATVYCSQPIPEEIMKAPFYVCKAETKRTFFMSRSRWVGYLMAGRKDFPLFSFARDFLSEYWSKMNYIVDYLLLDYIFELAYQMMPCVKEMIDSVPDNNLLRNELIGCLGEPYDEEKFKRFTDGDTMFYKLSWKFGNKDTQTPDGKLTNYGYMLSLMEK